MAIKDRRKGWPDERPEKAERRRQERRSAKRVPVSIWVEETRENELYFQLAGNISAGGVFFEKTIPHPVGTQVRLKFELPNGARIETEGEVVNIPNKEKGIGAGIRFVNLSPEDEKKILEFVDSRSG